MAAFPDLIGSGSIATISIVVGVTVGEVLLSLGFGFGTSHGSGAGRPTSAPPKIPRGLSAVPKLKSSCFDILLSVVAFPCRLLRLGPAFAGLAVLCDHPTPRVSSLTVTICYLKITGASDEPRRLRGFPG